jgi:hypothetical protein
VHLVPKVGSATHVKLFQIRFKRLNEYAVLVHLTAVRLHNGNTNSHCAQPPSKDAVRSPTAPCRRFSKMECFSDLKSIIRLPKRSPTAMSSSARRRNMLRAFASSTEDMIFGRCLNALRRAGTSTRLQGSPRENETTNKVVPEAIHGEGDHANPHINYK